MLFFSKFLLNNVYSWGHWYPCFALLVMCPLGLKKDRQHYSHLAEPLTINLYYLTKVPIMSGPSWLCDGATIEGFAFFGIIIWWEGAEGTWIAWTISRVQEIFRTTNWKMTNIEVTGRAGIVQSVECLPGLSLWASVWYISSPTNAYSQVLGKECSAAILSENV